MPKLPPYEQTAVLEPPAEDGSVAELLLLLLPILMIAIAMIFVVVAPFVMYLIMRLRPGIALRDSTSPVNVHYEEQLENSSSFQQACDAWLEQLDGASRAGYERAKRWCAQHPPMSPRDTDITMPQHVGIQEKGVSAWSFDPAYESHQGVMVSARTEIQFLADSIGMAPHEGGACSIQTNLPLPKTNEVYYWEAKIFEKPSTTEIAIGLATKPYPTFRFPGFCKHSVAYMSEDGSKCFNHPLHAQSYGPPYVKGDVVGVGYRPRTGSVFFTRNGVRMPEAFTGLYSHNLFPTIAVDGAAEVHVNFGQAGFVFIEANVKKWGLAPMVGTLAPPPAYGQDKDSILIEASHASSSSADGHAATAASTALLPVPPSYYDASAPVCSHDPRRCSDASGIHLTTLPGSVERIPSPPPYPAEEVATRSPLSTPSRGPTHTLQRWFSSWRRARRDTSAGSPETPSTELTGIMVDP